MMGVSADPRSGDVATVEMISPDMDEPADRAAPLDALLVDAALGPLRRLAPNSSTVRFAARLARHPVTTGRPLGSLTADLVRVGVGTSTTAPSKRDRRFADPAWLENPLLHRAAQGYLAAGHTAEQLLDDAHLDWRDDQRTRFLIENLVEAFSPSNLPLVNPASAKAAVDTAGLNFVRGAQPVAGPGQAAARPRDGGRVGLPAGRQPCRHAGVGAFT
jgi:polyhydroxyalkanoate synthase